MDETFSSIDLVTQCLLDEPRTKKFDEVVRKIITPNSVVLDAGTGSGVLALFAARAGAKKVFSIELDPYVAQLAQQNVINNGYQNVIEVMNEDVRNIHLPEGTHIDVVIMEMLTTGMIDEFQVWAINWLHQQTYIDKTTIFVPFKQDTHVSLTETDFSDYGLKMKMVKHFWDTLPEARIKYLSESFLLNSVSFDKINEMDHDSKHVVSIDKSGTLNSVYLTSVTWIDEKVSVGETLALNGPVSFPLENEISVKKGDKVEVEVRYRFGGGFRNFKVSARKV